MGPSGGAGALLGAAAARLATLTRMLDAYEATLTTEGAPALEAVLPAVRTGARPSLAVRWLSRQTRRSASSDTCMIAGAVACWILVQVTRAKTPPREGGRGGLAN